MILASFLVLSGSASATYPLPPYEQTVRVDDQDRSFIQSTILQKHEFDPICIPRDILCVGPIDPDLEVPLEPTGARVFTDDVYATGGHDPGRKVRYGPYAFPTALTDDLRVCWDQCPITDPAYGAVHGNVTVEIYADGVVYRYTYRVDQDFDSAHPSQIPRTWCLWAQYSNC